MPRHATAFLQVGFPNQWIHNRNLQYPAERREAGIFVAVNIAKASVPFEGNPKQESEVMPGKRKNRPLLMVSL